MENIDENLTKLLEEVHKIGLGEPLDNTDAEIVEPEEGQTDALVPAPTETSLVQTATPMAMTPLDDENSESDVNQEVISSMKDLISQGLDTIKTIKPSIEAAIEWKELTAYSGLIKATSDAIAVLNKLNIENKKNLAAKKLKALQISGKKAGTVSQTAIFIGSREDAIRQAKTPPAIAEGEIIDVKPD